MCSIEVDDFDYPTIDPRDGQTILFRIDLGFVAGKNMTAFFPKLWSGWGGGEMSEHAVFVCIFTSEENMPSIAAEITRFGRVRQRGFDFALIVHGIEPVSRPAQHPVRGELNL